MKMIGIVFIMLTVMFLGGCGNLSQPTLKAPPKPFIWRNKAYAHPALALTFGNRYSVPYKQQRPYFYMTSYQRRDTSHYINSWAQCESGIFGISGTGIKIGRSGEYCHQIMAVYIDLYRQGFPWGGSFSHMIKEKPFSQLMKTYRSCADIGKPTTAFIDEEGRGVFYCSTADGKAPQ